MYNKYTHKKLDNRSNIDETKYCECKTKLKKYELLKSKKCSDEANFEVLDISRATFYRWKRIYKFS